jgi:hypothetical protein
MIMTWQARIAATVAITTLVALALAALLARPSPGLSSRQGFFELDEPAARVKPKIGDPFR